LKKIKKHSSEATATGGNFDLKSMWGVSVGANILAVADDLRFFRLKGGCRKNRNFARLVESQNEENTKSCAKKFFERFPNCSDLRFKFDRRGKNKV
jgi:hypothetical protein